MAKTLTGIVVSTNMQKTITVSVERKFQHPRYRKIIRNHKKYKAHNENKDIKVGDIVTIQETRPISKDKHFEVVEKADAK